jgi:hypothetical protein
MADKIWNDDSKVRDVRLLGHTRLPQMRCYRVSLDLGLDRRGLPPRARLVGP